MDSEPSCLRRLLAVCLLWCWPLLSPVFSANHLTDAELDATITHMMDVVDSEVKDRLRALDQDLLDHRYDAAVRSAIRRYLRWEPSAGTLVGRTVQFFPIFEAHLRAAGLPEALKYLPIVETSLRPTATSHVGANGMWQFMEGTALEYGLRIDEWVDERLDVNRATEAAIRYLTNQYEYFEDWSLALAAYNAGKGRVRRAQRRSRGSDFWGVRRHLPRETRDYIPRFIAATYLAEFYAMHEVEPRLPDLDQQLTESVLVERPLSFYRIAQLTGLPVETIQAFNPAFRKGYLPGYPGGHYLVLPKRVMPAVREYLDHFPASKDEPVLPWARVLRLEVESPGHAADHYAEYRFTIMAGDSLQSIAYWTEATVSQLAVWNKLTPLDTLQIGDELRYFQPTAFRRLPLREAEVLVQRLPTASGKVVCSQRVGAVALPEQWQNHLALYLHRRARPSDIAARYPHLNYEELKADNQLSRDRALPAGTVLYIQRRR